MYVYVCMHIYKIPVVPEFSRRTWSPAAWGKTASLLIVFAMSVSESSLLHFPFRRLNEAKLQVFAIPVAAN